MEVGTAYPLWKGIPKIISLFSLLCLCDYESGVCVGGRGHTRTVLGWGRENLSGRDFHGKTISWETVVFQVSEGAHNARPASTAPQRCPPSSGSAADKSHRQLGSHSTAAEPLQTGCGAGDPQLGKERVRSLEVPPILLNLHPPPAPPHVSPGLRR